MKLAKPPVHPRTRRAFEAALVLVLVACVMLILRPVLKKQAEERAQQRAQAEALLDEAKEAGAKVKQVAELAPAIASVIFSGPSTTPEEARRKLAPLEIIGLTEQINEDPTNADLLFQRAQAHYIAQDYPKQFADLKRVLEIEPGSARALNSRAYTWAELGSFDKALPEALQACEKAPNPTTLDTLGYIYVGLERDTEALEVYTRGIEMLKAEKSTATPYMFWGRAAALRRLGQPEKAAEDFARAKQIDPDFCLHWEVEKDPGKHD